MKCFCVSAGQVAQFREEGFLIVEKLFTPEEVDLLLKIGKFDQEKGTQVRSNKDAEGRESKLWLTSEAREDIYNAFVRCHRLSDTMEKLLGDEIYLYHYKMMVKESRVGGAWEWHQDYGYWYNNQCLFPDMGSVMIAVDRASRENGCLQVLRGSHLCGRIDHGRQGTQTGADLDRVKLIEEHRERVYCEMAPGSAVFFHANLLHRSDANTSEYPRWTLICCYNTRHNPCEDRPGHPSYTFMEKWPDSSILEIGRRQWDEMQKTIAPANK